MRIAGPERASASRMRYPVRSAIEEQRRHASAGLVPSAVAARSAKTVVERTMRRGTTDASHTVRGPHHRDHRDHGIVTTQIAAS